MQNITSTVFLQISIIVDRLTRYRILHFADSLELRKTFSQSFLQLVPKKKRIRRYITITDCRPAFKRKFEQFDMYS
jgi:hypothetical protein